jgi:uncharacterized damage-inducible protein DinB
VAEQLLTDLLDHQAWADAELWTALEVHPASLEDAVIREKLNHIHLTQKAFLTIVRHLPLERSLFSLETNMELLKSNVRELHREIQEFARSSSDDIFSELITIPWFKDPPIRIPVVSALTQAAMHSHYHRAQNATRLRELGGSPPLTDLIVWYWKGKPAPGWGGK